MKKFIFSSFLVLLLIPYSGSTFSQEGDDLTCVPDQTTSEGAEKDLMEVLASLKVPLRPVLLGNSNLASYDKNIFQMDSLRQDDNKKCGFHALKNALYLLQGAQDSDSAGEVEQNILSSPFFKEVFKAWVKLKQEKGGEMDLNTDIDDILTLIKGLKKGSIPLPSGVSKNILEWISPFEINGVNFYDFDNIDKYPAQLSYLNTSHLEELLRAHRRLHQNQTVSHAFILGTPDYNENFSFLDGHWITMMANKVEGKTEYIITDSLNRPLDSKARRKNGVWAKKLKEILEMQESEIFLNLFHEPLDFSLSIFHREKTDDDKIQAAGTVAESLEKNWGAPLDAKVRALQGNEKDFQGKLIEVYQEKICEIIQFYLKLKEGDLEGNVKKTYQDLKEKFLCQ